MPSRCIIISNTTSFLPFPLLSPSPSRSFKVNPFVDDDESSSASINHYAVECEYMSERHGTNITRGQNQFSWITFPVSSAHEWKMDEWMAVDESVDTNWRYVVSHTTALTHNCVRYQSETMKMEFAMNSKTPQLPLVDNRFYSFSFFLSIQFVAFDWQFKPRIFAKNSRFENFGWNDIRWMEAMLRVCLRWFWLDLLPKPKPNSLVL